MVMAALSDEALSKLNALTKEQLPIPDQVL